MLASNSSTASENKTCPICKKPLIKMPDGSFKCDDCGYIEKLSTLIPNSELKQFLNDYNKTAKVSTDSDLQGIGGLYGWICPKCGAVMSPYESFCPNCTQRNWEVTCTTGTNNIKSNFDVNQFIGGRKDKYGYE
jgi:ribosomal protein L37AE/L43A